MSKRALLLKEINHIPEDIADQEEVESAIACESSLAKDRMLPEEDEAWQDL